MKTIFTFLLVIQQLVRGWTIPSDLQAVLAPEPHDALSDVIAKSPMLTLHRAICEVPSVTGNEEAVGDLLVSFLTAHNFSVTKQPVHMLDSNNTRFNIYAVPDIEKYTGIESVSSRPKVLLTSHIDTVPPHFGYALSSAKGSSRKDILVSGRGTVDDKACVATQISAVLDILSSASSSINPSDLALLFVVGEETTGDGMKHFSASKLNEQDGPHYKAVLFGEPTELKLAEGHKGITMLKLSAHGKAAHSGYPWLGRSANSMILPALLALDGLGDLPEDEGGLPRSKKFGQSTVNVGYMQGGVAGNVVPAYAAADVTFRLAGGTIPEVHEIIRAAVHKADPEDQLELEMGQGYGPVMCDADVEGFDTIAVNYGTDVPNLRLDHGVKRYLYGPGSIFVAHGADEGLTVGDMEEAVEGYKRLIKHALCA
jgi:acetylornithine deacetylase